MYKWDCAHGTQTQAMMDQSDSPIEFRVYSSENITYDKLFYMNKVLHTYTNLVQSIAVNWIRCCSFSSACINGTVHTAHKHKQWWTNQIHPPNSVYSSENIAYNYILSHGSVIVKRIRIAAYHHNNMYIWCNLYCIHDTVTVKLSTGRPHVKSVYRSACLSGVRCMNHDPIVERTNTKNRGTFGKRQQSVGRNDNLR